MVIGSLSTGLHYRDTLWVRCAGVDEQSSRDGRKDRCFFHRDNHCGRRTGGEQYVCSDFLNHFVGEAVYERPIGTKCGERMSYGS